MCPAFDPESCASAIEDDGYRLVRRDAYSEYRDNEIARPVRLGNATFGDGTSTIIAGPCAVERREQTLAIAEAVKAAGGHALRGGAFKPRTSPYDFQGYCQVEPVTGRLRR